MLTVSEQGPGSVTSNPPGISCGTTCSGSFKVGTTVSLTANPTAGFVFAGWSGPCSGTASCSIKIKKAVSVAAKFGANLQSINHIIFMAQENRGFLEYFGALPKYWADSNGLYPVVPFDGLPQFKTPPEPPPSIPGCDPAFPFPTYSNCQYDPNTRVQSYHTGNMCTEGLSPAWAESHYAYNFADPYALNPTPKLDGFAVMAADFARGHTNFMDVNGKRVMGYFTGDDLNYYYFMASNFATSDHWFAPVMTNTGANRMSMLAATSSGFTHARISFIM